MRNIAKPLIIAFILLFSLAENTEAQLPLADPYIFVENDTYYIYGTGSDQGIPVYTSKDLKTWKAQGIALTKKDTNIPKWFWAPEIYKIGKSITCISLATSTSMLPWPTLLSARSNNAATENP